MYSSGNVLYCYDVIQEGRVLPIVCVLISVVLGFLGRFFRYKMHSLPNLASLRTDQPGPPATRFVYPRHVPILRKSVLSNIHSNSVVSILRCVVLVKWTASSKYNVGSNEITYFNNSIVGHDFLGIDWIRYYGNSSVGGNLTTEDFINAFPLNYIAGFTGDKSKPNLLVSAKLPEHMYKTMKMFGLKPGPETDFKYPGKPSGASQRNISNMEELYQDPFSDQNPSDGVQREECYAVYKPKVKVKFQTGWDELWIVAARSTRRIHHISDDACLLLCRNRPPWLSIKQIGLFRVRVRLSL